MRGHNLMNPCTGATDGPLTKRDLIGRRSVRCDHIEYQRLLSNVA